MSSPFLKLWGMPILIGLLTITGLLSALLGDGIWDIVSAFALGLPVLIGLRYSLRGWRR